MIIFDNLTKCILMSLFLAIFCGNNINGSTVGILKSSLNLLFPPDPIDVELQQIMLLEATELIQSYGYPAENHTVETDDGYLLTLHRIPYGKSNRKSHGIPVLIGHGIFGISHQFFVSPQNGLAYRLADEGYDVWVGNWRGNKYTSHKQFTKNMKEFWEFVIDDMSFHDLPAMVHYILSVTNFKKLFYVGHSLGSVVAFGALTFDQDLNTKIAGFLALAPLTGIRYVTTPVVNPFFPALAKISGTMESMGFHKIADIPSIIEENFPYLCSHNNPFFCVFLLHSFCGYNPYFLNSTLLPIYVYYDYKGTSSYVIQQIKQVTQHPVARRFDFGPVKNMQLYNSVEPPIMAVENISVPTVLFYAANDAIADPIDVYITSRKLKNLVAMELIGPPNTAHNDFVWAMNTKELYQDTLVRYLKVLWK